MLFSTQSRFRFLPTLVLNCSAYRGSSCRNDMDTHTAIPLGILQDIFGFSPKILALIRVFFELPLALILNKGLCHFPRPMTPTVPLLHRRQLASLVAYLTCTVVEDGATPYCRPHYHRVCVKASIPHAHPSSEPVIYAAHHGLSAHPRQCEHRDSNSD